MEATFGTSEKGKSLLVIDGYTFSFQKMLVKDTVRRWQCSKRTCKAFVKTQSTEDIIVESVLNHNHEKLTADVFNRKLVSNSIKRKAVGDICEKPLKLIQSEIDNRGIDTFTTKDIVRVRQNIYNARASALIKQDALFSTGQCSPKNSEQLENVTDVLDLSKPEESSLENRQNVSGYKSSVDDISSEEEDDETITTMFSNVEVVENEEHEETCLEKTEPSSSRTKKGNLFCHHCDILFGVPVMYTLHMGYHGYKDPFTCNMCGEECHDRTNLFLHIARNPHY